MCVNNQSLSGHYYATNQSRPPRTNPVSNVSRNLISWYAVLLNFAKIEREKKSTLSIVYRRQKYQFFWRDVQLGPIYAKKVVLGRGSLFPLGGSPL